MKRIHRWLLVALVFAVAASAAFADTSDQEASGPFVGPRLSTRKRVSAMLAHHQKAKSQHLSAARHKFRSTAAAEAEAEAKDEGGEGGGKVIVLDIAPGIIGIANTGQPPAPIPTGESVFGNLRAKQVYPSYPTNNPADKQFTGDKEQSFLEADMYSLASSEEGEEGGAEAAKPDPRPKSGWPRIGQLHMDDVEPAKGSWRVTNAVMHLGPQGHRLDILPESNPFEPLRALVEAEATASEGGEPTTKVADLPPQHPSSLYAGLPPAPPSSAPNPFGPLEVFLESDSPRTRRRNYMSRFRATSERTTHEATAGEAGDLQVIKVADIPPQHPSSINTGLPPPPPTKFPNPFGSLEVFLERRSASSSLETPGTGMGRFAARARPGAEPVEFAGGVRVRNPPPKPKKDGGKAKGKGNGKGKAGGKGKGKADAKGKGKGKADAKGKGKADAKNKPKAKPKGSRRSQAALERAVAGMGEGAEKSDEPAESGQKIIFDFPPGYFGFGGYGEKFESKPIFEHPQNPLNLNPYGGLEPKAGVLEEGDWKPPEGVGKNPFGPLRT